MQMFGKGLWAALALATVTAATAVEVASAPSGVRYASGGITATELKALQAARRNFSLLVRPVSLISGGPLIDAAVRIELSDGRTVLTTEMDGPWLLVALAPGRYRVAVTFQDETLVQLVDIPVQGERELVLRFRSDAEVSALAKR